MQTLTGRRFVLPGITIRAAAAVGPVNCNARKKRIIADRASIAGETAIHPDQDEQEDETESIHKAPRRAARTSGLTGATSSVPSAVTCGSKFFISGNGAI